METVYKYFLEGRITKLELPVGSELLTAHEQEGKICVWVEQNREAGMAGSVEIELHAIPTGGDVPTNSLYVGTVFIGDLVWHIYLVEEHI
jgi:hypothetical protein